ncbi:MAG: peptidyl-prolyl cis-trans isomerase [Planctomycetota bacterium]|nr:MAG: peptidyl-prolyl cis-trans isomerase [Planctomycetota bacterium]
MTATGLLSRQHAATLAAALAISLGIATPSSGQRIANQFDNQSAGATQAPPMTGPASSSTSTTNLTPHIPRPVSRPDSWPGRKPGGNHVLSSIRSRPGGELEPISEPPPSVTRAGGVPPATQTPGDDGGVEQTAFTEPDLLDISGAESLDTTQVIARVGPEVVLEGDLLTPTALEWLAKVTPGMKPGQIRELKRQICKQVLPQHVESLIVYVDACRTIPEKRLPEIEKKVGEAFDAQQLPQMVKQSGLGSLAEYEQQLRSRGQSLDRLRKMFFERALAQQWVQQKVTTETEIPHADMIAWYQNHLAEYEYPAKARFEQFTIRLAPRQPRQEAWNRLAAMGNDVLEGQSFIEVARERSESPAAPNGGQFDWTTKGSLVSKVVDEAIFTLPVGQLSAILEDSGGLHIVRVIERIDAGRTPFIEAQVGIRESLTQERRKKGMDDYLKKLRERTPVWTIFDDAEGTVSQASATSPATGRSPR